METIEGRAKAFCEKNICGIPADHKYIPKYSTRLAGGKFTNNDSGWGTGACRRTGGGDGLIRSAGMYDTLPVLRSVWALIPLGNMLVTAITFPA